MASFPPPLADRPAAVRGWDPEQYLRFKRERRLPYDDLVALIEPRPNMRIVDLGCGTGMWSADLASRFDATSVLGVDLSESMLADAAKYADHRVRFERADLHGWTGQGYDLVFSNAALHWVGDHARVFERLRDAVVPGGQVAVHMPNNMHRPTHAIARALAAEEPYASALEGRVSGMAVCSAEDYSELLWSLGFERQVVRESVYLHELPDAEAAVEWVRGSMLTWYRERLSPELYAHFFAAYRERLLDALPQGSPMPFTYRRILLWATRPA